ncbi:translocator protein isoform 1-T1 [Fundulus diaphanus]
MTSWLPMIGLTALPQVGGLYGGFITRKEVKTWYPTLNKPSWRPPNAAFPVVWTCLYTGMGYGSYLIWKELGGFTEDALVPLGLYGLQLALNWAWTPIFFGAHKLKWASFFSSSVVLLINAGADRCLKSCPSNQMPSCLCNSGLCGDRVPHRDGRSHHGVVVSRQPHRLPAPRSLPVLAVPGHSPQLPHMERQPREKGRVEHLAGCLSPLLNPIQPCEIPLQQ